jgi:hypothetical protein
MLNRDHRNIARMLLLSAWVGLIGLNGLWIESKVAIAQKKEAAIYEDNLNTADGLRWSGPKLPYRKTVDIRDSLVDTPLGKVTADRHGSSPSVPGVTPTIVDLIGGTFTNPIPGRSAFISLWGSKIEGCFVEMIIQVAPTSNTIDAESIVPKLLELGVGSQLLELPPQSTVQPKILSQNYQYSNLVGGVRQVFSATWYMTRNVFVVDSTIAKILSNAPAADARARLTFLNGQKVLIPIKKETVSSWKTAYAFNPSCLPPDKLAQQQALGQKPLLKAFAGFSGTTQQVAALNWLQDQVPPNILKEFVTRWRGGSTQVAKDSFRLVNAAKSYKKFRKQEDALTWLQQNLSKEVLDGFLKKWS